MRKKVVFLPYDFDTAIGINNEGSLVFSYNLEDTDQVDGANVFNGQDSVLWCNLRDTFPNEIEAMYKQLRSDGILSYNRVEKQFEEHQNKWPEALFNEDAKFKYLDPLENDNDATYLPMLQGSKAEQRKWWLFNRFRYMDSKFNAGDALTDYIQLRGYAKGNITITPYADIYPTIKYGSYLVRTRGERDHAYELVCPLSDMNDTEIYIYSASALSSIGDISPLKVGLADFSRAIKLTDIKVGDSASGYSNPNLKSLTLGNNTLLRKIDARNCTNLGADTQKTINLTGCTGLEEVYFDGTAISGLDLPNGGVMKKIHLPGTITYLTLRNHTGLTEFVCPDYSNITTLWLENPAPIIDTAEIVNELAAGSRIRLYNFHWEMATLGNVYTMFDRLDTMRGLDQNGNNTNKAQVYGSIHVESATTFEVDEIHSRYSDVTITYDELMPGVIYKTSDGSATIGVEPVHSGGSGTRLLPPDKAADVQYTYTPSGWSLTPNGSADTNALTNITSDRIVYAVYTTTVNTYPITFRRGADDGNDVLETVNIAYGQTAAYPGSNPTSSRGSTYSFIGWTPALATVTGPATYTAEFRAPVTVTYKDWDETTITTENVRYGGNASQSPSPTRASTAQYSYSFAGWSSNTSGTVSADILKNLTQDKVVYAIYTTTLQSYTITFVKASADGGGTLQTSTYTYGSMPSYNGTTPTTTQQGDFQFTGWTPTLAAVTGSATYTAVFRDMSNPVVQYLKGTMTEYDNDEDTKLDDTAFYQMTSLTSVKTAATVLTYGAFNGCSNLTKVEFTDTVTIPSSIFKGLINLNAVILDSTTLCTLSNIDALESTAIAAGRGAIYVPDTMVDTYKAATNWSIFFISPKSAYPLTDFSTISDDWDTIISYANAGTIGDHYGVNDIKKLTINGIDYYAQLVGINKDTLSSDHTTKANSTWLLKTILSYNNGNSDAKYMNKSSTTVGGWTDTEMRNTTLPAILATFPANLQSAIKAVDKVSYRFEDTSEQTTSDKLWIPSSQEINLRGTYLKETTGIVYDGTFTTRDLTRIRTYNNGSNGYWYLRSAFSATDFVAVTAAGYNTNTAAANPSGVLLGFCI